MARSMLPDASEADEAAEETFLLALQSRELFPLEVSFRTSLYRVAMDRSLTRLRASSERAADLLPAFDAAARLASAERRSEIGRPRGGSPVQVALSIRSNRRNQRRHRVGSRHGNEGADRRRSGRGRGLDGSGARLARRRHPVASRREVRAQDELAVETARLETAVCLGNLIEGDPLSDARPDGASCQQAEEPLKVLPEPVGMSRPHHIDRVDAEALAARQPTQQPPP